MTAKRKIILWCGILIVLACLAYPPHQEVQSLTDGMSTTKFVGYHLITRPPEADNALATVSIDTTRLFIQLGAVVAVIGGLYSTTE